MLLFAGATLSVAIITLRPVPIMPEERLSVAEGTIDHIFEAGEFDIVFTIRESGKHYYINRGIEQGLSVEDLRDKLLNQKVTIKYPEFWSLMGSENVNHLSKLIFRDQVIYTELEADLTAKN